MGINQYFPGPIQDFGMGGGGGGEEEITVNIQHPILGVNSYPDGGAAAANDYVYQLYSSGRVTSICGRAPPPTTPFFRPYYRNDPPRGGYRISERGDPSKC